jgi:hypothetical protein
MAALFVMLGKSAENALSDIPEVAPNETVLLSPTYDLALLMPDRVKRAIQAADTYKLFFVFEGYLRDFVVEVLSKENQASWWDKVPPDVQQEMEKLEETEEVKGWMAVGSRSKAQLLTYPQLFRIMDHAWKSDFEDLVLDKALIQQARMLGHLRNTICHMTELPEDETERVRRTIRDWFRVVAP